MTGRIKIYVGQDEETMEDFLYTELQIPNREIILHTSDSINDGTLEDFLQALSDSLNEATIWVRHLGIPIVVNREELMAIAEELEEDSAEKIVRLLKEVTE